jgi:hypothetical protein
MLLVVDAGTKLDFDLAVELLRKGYPFAVVLDPVVLFAFQPKDRLWRTRETIFPYAMVLDEPESAPLEIAMLAVVDLANWVLDQRIEDWDLARIGELERQEQERSFKARLLATDRTTEDV